MSIRRLFRKIVCSICVGIAFLAVMNFAVGVPISNAELAASLDRSDHSSRTRTPIKHVIVIIGENRTFDHIFATYVPRHGRK